jgi:hypothetical protein
MGMKRISAIACLLTVASFAAPALAGDMSGYYGNTVVCTAADGGVTKVWVKQGGTYTVQRGGKNINGTWVDNGDKVCYTETDPASPAGTPPFCVSSELRKAGATWSLTDPGGNASQCVLKDGNT